MNGRLLTTGAKAVGRACALLALVCALEACAVNPATQPDDLTVLKAQAQAWDEAIVRKDRSAIEANMAEDFRQIDGQGNLESLQSFVDDLMSPDLVIHPYRVADFEIRMYGDVALLSGRTNMTGTDRSKPFASHYRYIDVYARRGAAWKIVSVQISPMPAAKPAPAASQQEQNMPSNVTETAVTQFLHRFEALALQEDFNLIRHLIDERAVFRFNDGDFFGRDAIQAAFEKTWRGDPSVKKARFYLSDIVVLTTDAASATATYTYNWEGSQAGKSFSITGRGTRVLRFEQGEFRIVHEHLSRFPRPQ